MAKSKMKSIKPRKFRDVRNFPSAKIRDFLLDGPRLYGFLVCFLPVALYFSYFPVISLGGDGTMNFELSVALIYLVIFDAVTVFALTKKKMWRGIKWWWLLLPLWLTISVMWSGNLLRGVLTAGIGWLVGFAGYGIIILKDKVIDERFLKVFWKVFFTATVLVCVWCLVQCVLDLVGVSREGTLMCAGCTYEMFGFPHPNGFAIEPQFMGNLLLAPALIIGYFILRGCFIILRKQTSSRPDTLQGRSGRSSCSGAETSPACLKSEIMKQPLTKKYFAIMITLFLATATTLFLTFSRGAIYAFVVAIVVMVGVAIVRWRKVRGAVLVIFLTAVAFIIALIMQGAMAEVSKTNDTFESGVQKVINHLSLNVIKFEKDDTKFGEDDADFEEDEAVNNREEEIHDIEMMEHDVEMGRHDAVFDGYVAESTETRLKLTNAAFVVWRQDFATAMFGVGLGGAGQALYDHDLMPAPKEIVQNEYASLLLETGVVGIVLAFGTLGIAIYVVMKKSSARVLIISMAIAYGITLCFFSGLPNALQVYLMPVVVYAVMGRKVLE